MNNQSVHLFGGGGEPMESRSPRLFFCFVFSELRSGDGKWGMGLIPMTLWGDWFDIWNSIECL